MGLDNPDLINRTVVRQQRGDVVPSSASAYGNVCVTNAFKNKMDDPLGRPFLHLHFDTMISFATRGFNILANHYLWDLILLTIFDYSRKLAKYSRLKLVNFHSLILVVVNR